jgi:hypothetical protein
MSLPRLFVFLILAVFGTATSGEGSVADTYNAIVAKAKARSPDYQQVEQLFPASFVELDFESLARRLMLDGLDLDELGEAGVVYKWSAIDAALYKLSEMPDGGHALVRIMESEDLPIRDSQSATLCDAMLRKGKEMLPLLAKATKRRELARWCSGLIVEGRKSAF